MKSMRELRVKQNIKQEAIATAMGVSVATVSRWETGEFFPQADKLPLLARVLGCTIDELLAEEQDDV